MTKQTYTSDPNYIFTTRYTDYEIDANAHPEATCILHAKAGYKIVVGKFTTKMCNEFAGNTAFCTALIMSGGKRFDGIKEVSTDATVYTDVSFDIDKTIETQEDVTVYLHMKTSSDTSKAKVQSFDFDYEYVKIDEEEPPINGALDYIISFEGTTDQVNTAMALIKKSIGDNVKDIEVYTKKS